MSASLMRSLTKLRESLTYSKLKAVHLLFQGHGYCDANPSDKFYRDAKGEITAVQERKFPNHVPVDPEQVEKFKSDPFKYTKKHAGIMRLKTVTLPTLLEENIRMVLAEKELLHKGFEEECSRIVEVFKNRQPPIEHRNMTKEYCKVLDKVMDEELAKRNITLQQLPVEEQEKFSKLVDKVTRKAFFATHYHWKPIDYSGYNTLIYVAARLAPNYAVMLQVLQEIKRDNPAYVPDFVYNYGSGSCSAVWASNTLWENKVYEYFCTDTSRDMNRLAQKLMATDIHDPTESAINGVHFRMFQSSSKNRYSLVISGYLMTEMENKERHELVEKLWKQTGDYLVLVETGSTAGYNLIMEARDIIQNMMQSDPELEGHVIAPCTHGGVCPKQVMKRPICNFTVTYAGLPLTRKATQNFIKQTERYMYVIFKKGPREKALEYPRILDKRVTRGGSYCLLCCPDGEIQNCIIGKTTSEKVLYNSVKKVDVGDLLPVLWSEYNPDTHNIERLESRKEKKYWTKDEQYCDDSD